MKYVLLGANGEVTGGGEGPDGADVSHLGSVQLVPSDSDIKVFSQWWDGSALQSVPAAPSSRHVWDWTTKTWALPSTIRADMKQLIRAEASRRLVYPFNNSGTFFRCDAQGQSAIIGAATLYPLTVPSGWTWPDINNVPIAMTSPEWQLFWNAVANRPMQIQSVVEFLFSLVDDPEVADAVVAAIEPATDTYWPETARP